MRPPAVRRCGCSTRCFVRDCRSNPRSIAPPLVSPLRIAGLAHAIAATVLRWSVDLDRLIDGATARPLPADAKARTALRIALGQALVLGTPGHAAIATVLPLVDGGPRKLVHGVFGAISRAGATLPPVPTLPAGLAARWSAAWGDEMVAAAATALAAQPPTDLTLRDPRETDGLAAAIPDAVSLMPGHLRVPAASRVADLPGYAEGRWWVQDLAASLPVRVSPDAGRAAALDLCAAPGGKAMQLAAAGWTVTAIDQSARRLERMRENLERTGLAATLLAADIERWEPAEPAESRASRRAMHGDRHLPPPPRRASSRATCRRFAISPPRRSGCSIACFRVGAPWAVC